MREELDLAIQTIYNALTTTWEDNGNIMAEAVRDSVVMNLEKLTGRRKEKIWIEIDKLVEAAQ
jgi:hypothetical protein